MRGLLGKPDLLFGALSCLIRAQAVELFFAWLKWPTNRTLVVPSPMERLSGRVERRGSGARIVAQPAELFVGRVERRSSDGRIVA